MINLFIIKPENIGEKYILEHSLQKEFYKEHIKKNKIKINYIPSYFPERKFFNKYFSIINYFKSKNIKHIPENSFYIDHDIFIFDLKYIKNLYKNKLFFHYSPKQYFDWNKLFKENFKIDINPQFQDRFSSPTFPLYNFFLKKLEQELQLFYRYEKEFIESSALFEEYFFTKIIIENKFKTIPFKYNNCGKIYSPFYELKNSFILKMIKINPKLKNNIKKLREFYKKVKHDFKH